MLKRIIKKIRGNQRDQQGSKASLYTYINYFETLPIEEHQIVLEARNGRTIDGNCFYILKELLENPKYEGFNLFVVAFDEETIPLIKRKLSQIDNDRIKMVVLETEEYYRVMASAKYIVNDSAIRNFFIKKEGQIYLNVWHGTPLKTMGRRVSHEPHATGSVQKNFIIADYLLYPSEYMRQHMIEDYMIADLSNAEILMGGYPRNTIFFDASRREEIRDNLQLSEKRVYAYMPTWRPDMMEDELQRILEEMDRNLHEDEIMYLNVHPLADSLIAFERLNKIRRFPGEVEVYEFLNIADCLITDYSSVFYDFAITGKKIILFTYDEEEYFKTRGLYEPLDTLPFDQVKTVPELLDLMRSPKDYDDTDFLRKYCPYESKTAARDLCSQFIFGETHLEKLSMPSNGKKNILVYGGDLAPGERTIQVMRFLENVNENANYYLVFNKRDLVDHKEVLLRLPDGIRYYGRTGKLVLSPEQKKAKADYNKGKLSFEQYWDIVKPAFAREKKRYFGDAHIDEVIEIPEGPVANETSTPMELELSTY